ncbi:MAG: hypothetical protein HYY30_09240 [Chloroflexi bacterium]|nr:hypothetical protein [Chloroflexota bacterium]
MQLQTVLAKLVFILGTWLVLPVLLLPAVSIAYAAEKTATVALNPYGGPAIGVDAVTTKGEITVTSITGPAGGVTLSLTVDTTIAGHDYVLYLGRNGSSFRIISNITTITGNGGSMTINGIQLKRAPTNGQSFELVDRTAGRIVAISEPIKY